MRVIRVLKVLVGFLLKINVQGGSAVPRVRARDMKREGLDTQRFDARSQHWRGDRVIAYTYTHKCTR